FYRQHALAGVAVPVRLGGGADLRRHLGVGDRVVLGPAASVRLGLRLGLLRRGLLLGHALGVLLAFLLPALVGLGGIDLVLEALRHLLGDVGAVDVELVVPAAQLVDRAVVVAQQGVFELGLV